MKEEATTYIRESENKKPRAICSDRGMAGGKGIRRKLCPITVYRILSTLAKTT